MGFVQRMEPFYADASRQLSALNADIAAANSELARLAKWFGVEEGGDGDKLEFLKQLNAFRKSFDGIGARLELRAKQKLRKERRAKKAAMTNKGRRRKRKAMETSKQRPSVRG